jgi:hypothetical protein
MVLMSLQEAFRASLSRLSAKRVEIATQGSYGRSVFGYAANYDQGSHSLRTFQGCLSLMEDEPSTEFLATWQRSGMIVSGILSPLFPLVRVIGANDSGCLPTPQAQDAKGYIPQAAKSQLMGIMHRKSGADISKDMKHCPVFYPAFMQTGSRKWNPYFFERIMGYPTGHTKLDASEIPSFRKSRKSSHAQSTKS